METTDLYYLQAASKSATQTVAHLYDSFANVPKDNTAEQSVAALILQAKQLQKDLDNLIECWKD